jgi:hypothetical protein
MRSVRFATPVLKMFESCTVNGVATELPFSEFTIDGPFPCAQKGFAALHNAALRMLVDSVGLVLF